jgi:hypothetical protein
LSFATSVFLSSFFPLVGWIPPSSSFDSVSCSCSSLRVASSPWSLEPVSCSNSFAAAQRPRGVERRAVVRRGGPVVAEAQGLLRPRQRGPCIPPVRRFAEHRRGNVGTLRCQQRAQRLGFSPCQVTEERFEGGAALLCRLAQRLTHLALRGLCARRVMIGVSATGLRLRLRLRLQLGLGPEGAGELAPHWLLHLWNPFRRSLCWHLRRSLRTQENTHGHEGRHRLGRRTLAKTRSHLTNSLNLSN